MVDEVFTRQLPECSLSFPVLLLQDTWQPNLGHRDHVNTLPTSVHEAAMVRARTAKASRCWAMPSVCDPVWFEDSHRPA